MTMKKKIVINTGDTFRTVWKEPKGSGDVIAVSLAVTALIMAVIWYFALPAINLKSIGFWLFLLLGVFIYTAVKLLTGALKKKAAGIRTPFIILTALVVGLVGNLIYSSRLLHAKAYSEILQAKEADIDLIPSVSGSSSIALMDTASAEMLGDRKIGSLSNVVSQFNVGSYMQINYQEAPVKVAAL
jgi:hypothetical protein